MRNKQAEGHIGTCIMILVFCIITAVLISFMGAINTIRISKRNTYKVIDGYVTSKTIEGFDSIKVGTDYTEQLDNELFTEYFCTYNDLTQNGNTLSALTDNGYEKYRVTNLHLSFIQEKTLKLQVDYMITVPISFGDFTVINAQVPIKIKSNYTNKYEGDFL